MLGLATAPIAGADVEGAAARWWKGNLHTHSLWSDGDDYPEMIADWYKDNGYNFLAFSDHNISQEGLRWLELKPTTGGSSEGSVRGDEQSLDKYLARFGPHWVEQRVAGGARWVRLKPLAEFRSLFEEPGEFLLIQSEELTTKWKREATAAEGAKGGPVHINVTNLRDLIEPVAGTDARSVMQQNIDLVIAQRERTGQPMIPHLNHPNFHWGVTAEELMGVRGENFFEVYNGHPGVQNAGDAGHLSTDQIWDVILTGRLAGLQLPPMFGLATDDAHNHHESGLDKSNPGRGWIMVRARFLTPESIVHAMEAGDFYATTGVLLDDVNREGNTLRVEIASEAGVTYRIQFIGTRSNYDRSSEIIPSVDGAEPTGVPHRRYSSDVGAVLAEVRDTKASYTLEGDEIYVRAKIISSKSKPNASTAGEFECAWTQPLVGRSR